MATPSTRARVRLVESAFDLPAGPRPLITINRNSGDECHRSHEPGSLPGDDDRL
jgi:hypothetical protein